MDFKKLWAGLLAVCLTLGGSAVARADEGMWLPMLLQKLNMDDMQRLGVRLTAEEIYAVNHSSLKDAIVQFGEGCTGEIVSADGLLFTNHHCGYGQIQAHSSVEHDYLSEGFWAQSLEDELPNPGLTVKFLVRMEDVTGEVNAGLRADMSESERADSIRTIAARIKARAEEGTHYMAMVKSYSCRQRVLSAGVRGIQGCPSRRHAAQFHRQVRCRRRQLDVAASYRRFFGVPRVLRARRQAGRIQ